MTSNNRWTDANFERSGTARQRRLRGQALVVVVMLGLVLGYYFGNVIVGLGIGLALGLNAGTFLVKRQARSDTGTRS